MNTKAVHVELVRIDERLSPWRSSSETLNRERARINAATVFLLAR